MIKQTIKYTDFNGTERNEDFYFNLTKAEVTEMELSQEGGLTATIQKVIDEKDSKKMVEIFKDLILKSYGEKSEDGRRFIKNDKIREEFAQTEAYSELFYKLATNAEEATAFVNGITPSAL